MLIICLKTDQPNAELLLCEDAQILQHITWPAHRGLAESLHYKIDELLKAKQKQLTDIAGLVAYKGPGSFTGLRIGLSVINAIAYAQQLPIVGVTGDDWAEQGVQQLLDGQNDVAVMPEYGAEPHITQPKK